MRLILAAALALAVAAPASAAPIIPLAPQQQLTATELSSEGPALVHDPTRDRYLFAYETDDDTVNGRFLDAAGVPVGDPFPLGPEEPGAEASRPSAVYNADADEFAIAYIALTDAEPEREVWVTRIPAAGGAPLSQEQVTANGDSNNDNDATGVPVIAYARPGFACPYRVAFTYRSSFVASDKVYSLGVDDDGTSCLTRKAYSFSEISDDPELVYRPGADQWLLAFWDGDGSASIIRLVGIDAAGDPIVGESHDVDVAPDDWQSFHPSLTVLPDDRLLLAWELRRSPGHETDTRTLALSADLEPAADDVGHVGDATAAIAETSGGPQVEWNAALGVGLLTWTQAGDDIPGHVGEERSEIVAQPVDAAGEAIGPRFAVSEMGTIAGGFEAREDVAIAAGGRRWFSAWSGNTAATDGLNQVFGRLIGEDLDLDDDGVSTPADCDDANPAVPRPEIPDNGIDEDCSGADTVTPPAPVAGLTGATLDATFRKGKRTRVRRFRVLNAVAGMTVEIRCKKRKRCPKKLRKARRLTVSSPGTINLRPRVGRRLKPKVRLRIRLIEGGKIGREYRFRMRKRKQPRRSVLCIPAGSTSAGPCA